MRLYQDEEDWWRIREFLRRVFLLNGRRELSWHVARMDYWRWHGIENLGDGKLDHDVFIWEKPDGEIAAVLNRESAGDVFLQEHPDWRSADLQAEMIGVAEERLSIVRPNGRRQVTVWTDSRDDLRHSVLARRGYIKGSNSERQWRRRLDAPIAEAPLPLGYTVRALGDGLELLERSYASGLGFHEGDIAIAVGNRQSAAWYRNIQNAPLYRRDLDLVAVAPDGAIASFATIWFDDVTQSAYFEPVATVPEHRRRGLAKATITEGLKRLKRMGAVVAFVGGYSDRANALYASTMSPECDLSEPWTKDW